MGWLFTMHTMNAWLNHHHADSKKVPAYHASGAKSWGGNVLVISVWWFTLAHICSKLLKYQCSSSWKTMQDAECWGIYSIKTCKNEGILHEQWFASLQVTENHLATCYRSCRAKTAQNTGQTSKVIKPYSRQTQSLKGVHELQHVIRYHSKALFLHAWLHEYNYIHIITSYVTWMYQEQETIRNWPLHLWWPPASLNEQHLLQVLLAPLVPLSQGQWSLQNWVRRNEAACAKILLSIHLHVFSQGHAV